MIRSRKCLVKNTIAWPTEIKKNIEDTVLQLNEEYSCHYFLVTLPYHIIYMAIDYDHFPPPCIAIGLAFGETS